MPGVTTTHDAVISELLTNGGACTRHMTVVLIDCRHGNWLLTTGDWREVRYPTGLEYGSLHELKTKT